MTASNFRTLVEASFTDVNLNPEKIYKKDEFAEIPKDLRDFMADKDLSSSPVYGYSAYRNEPVDDKNSVNAVSKLPNLQNAHIIIMCQHSPKISLHPPEIGDNHKTLRVHKLHTYKRINDEGIDPSPRGLTAYIDNYIRLNGGYEKGWSLLIVWGKKGNLPSFKNVPLPKPD